MRDIRTDLEERLHSVESLKRQAREKYEAEIKDLEQEEALVMSLLSVENARFPQRINVELLSPGENDVLPPIDNEASSPREKWTTRWSS